MVKIISFLIALLLVSCVVIPKKNDLLSMSTQSYSESCQRTGIAVSFTGKIFSDLYVETKIGSSEVWRGSKNLSSYIINKLNATNFITTPPNEITPQKYFINFIVTTRNYSNLFQRSTLWISDLTLGLFPGWGDGEYFLTAEIYDLDGKKIKDYNSTIVAFDYYHGLIFLPINSYEHTRANLNERYLPHMTSEIIDAMIKDKLFDCT